MEGKKQNGKCGLQKLGLLGHHDSRPDIPSMKSIRRTGRQGDEKFKFFGNLRNTF